MFVTDRRFGRLRAGRRSLRGIGLVALAAALVAVAVPATAAAMPHGAGTLKGSAGVHERGDGNMFAGSPRIGAVRALVPRRGRYAGRLIVWARVDHAPATRRALSRKRPETIQTGRVVARVGNRSRFATQRLELSRSRVAHGYFMRFSNPATRKLLAAGRQRVPVSLRVAQTVDLDSDGDLEDRALATTTRNVPLARPAATSEPKDGTYTTTSNSDSIQVSQGAVTHYTFGGLCPLDHEVHFPIDPTFGTFNFVDSPQHIGPNTNTMATAAVQGRFTSDTRVTVTAQIYYMVNGHQSRSCHVTEELAEPPNSP